MYLIIGASGMLGGTVARQLLAQGKPVRAMSRTPEKLGELRQMGAQVVQGDLTIPDSISSACKDVEKILAAAHSMMGRGKYRSEAVDDIGHRHLIDIARKSGVKHFVYTSIYGAVPDHPIDFWRTKYSVEQHLRSSGMSFTILRPTAFVDFHAHLLIGKPILENGKVTLFGVGNAPRNFVTVKDVAEFAEIALEDPKAKGDLIEIGGPENLSNQQVVEIYARLSGRSVKVNHVPLPVLGLMQTLIKPLHPGLSRIMRVSIHVDRHGDRFDPSYTLQKYPKKLTRLEDWVQGKVMISRDPQVLSTEI
jgi:NADH dehydrogenase